MGIWPFRPRRTAPGAQNSRASASQPQAEDSTAKEKTMSSKSRHPETLALHAGWRADPSTGSVAVPIHQTTSYQFRDTEHASNLFALKELGNIYTRIMNPTNDVLEKRIAEIEGGVAALAVSSGQAASAFAIQNIARAGDNIVSSTDLYGGTWNLFANTLKDQGIEVRFVDPADPENFRRATDAKTRAYYAETLPNPKLAVFPIAEVAAIGRPLGIPLIVDNTAAPLLARPFDHGAAVIVYSATKYLGGHGTTIGGLIVDGGNFDWGAHPERQPALNTPDPSYHGAVWSEAVKPLGPIAYIIKARVTLLRDLGSALSPFNAFQILQGIETLPLRIQRHSENALAVANYLSKRPEVSRVIHPSQQTGVPRERAEKYLKGGQGGLVGFELAAGREAGRRFIDALELFYHVANIGDAKSLAIHPATTTHSQLTPASRIATGVSDGYVRLSIGLEHIDDILADLERGLAAAGSVAKAA
jgi:O-acetylhomoserine (thiol)-lyase